MDPINQIHFTLNFTGFWFSYTKKNNLHIIFSVVKCFIFYFNIFYILLQVYSDEVNGFADPKLNYLPGSILIIVSQIIFYFKRDKIKIFLKEFNEVLLQDEIVRDKFKSFYLKSWKYIKLFYAFQLTGYSVNFIFPLLGEITYIILGRNDYKHLPPFSIINLKLIGINIDGQFRNFVLTVCAAVFALAWELLFCGIITFSCIVLSFTAFEFKLFKYRIETYYTNDLLEDTDGTIRVIVWRHRQLLRLFQLVKNILALPLGFQNLIISVCLCLFSFIVITVNNMGEAIPFTYGVIAFTQIALLYGYLGDRVRTEGENVFTALCHLPWYKLNPKNRKSLIMILLQARKLLQIEYEGILKTNLESFLQIMQMAYSCFTLLKSKN